ncbi:hypothetical protein [Neptuniibacter marinus]|uniref:hypothetical protein n=1 Tax=Neptuniibacter marinus TaxID=1806670 RepID=UPI000832517A|nr:hypothetical protein [Neptuniibacter marinus]
MRLICILLISVIIVGCQGDISENDYFPVNKGVEWHYSVFEDLTDITQKRQFSIKNLGTIDLKGDYSGMPVSARRTSDGTVYYILQDDTGSYRIAKRTVVELTPRFDDKEIRILPNKEDLEVGRSWVAETRSYALHGLRSALPDPSKKAFSLTYEIVALNSSVVVPAGRFDNCIKVEASGVISLYADPRLGYQDIIVTQTEWYAPGVGLVKLVRNEPMDLEIYKGGSITFELNRFES